MTRNCFINYYPLYDFGTLIHFYILIENISHKTKTVINRHSITQVNKHHILTFLYLDRKIVNRRSTPLKSLLK